MIMIIVILGIFATPLIPKLRARAQRVRCATNLKNLAVAAELFVQQNGAWPQIPAPAAGTPQEAFAESWISALGPFGTTRDTWICPTMQNLLRNPDYTQPENARVDYISTPFDDKPTSPHEWPRQPWFIERGDVHGNGNLIIFTDGSISDLKTVLGAARRQP